MIGSNTIWAKSTAGPTGSFSVQLPLSLNTGTITLFVKAVDLAGNLSPSSNLLTVTIVSVTSDYNDDSYADAALLDRNTTTNQGLWLVKSTLVGPAIPPAPGFWFASGTPFGPSNAIPFQGDFDGDGKSDLAYYVPSTATWAMVDSRSVTLSTFVLGTPNLSVPVVGYFDANAPEEVGAYTYVPGQGGVWNILSSTGGMRTVTIPIEVQGDIPVPGAYDGLGYDQLAFYRPSTGIFYVLQPGGTIEQLNPGQGGSANLLPVPGAYDNQAYFNAAQPEKTEAAVYNPYTGVYSILGPGGGIYNVSKGYQIGDIPVPADYTGSGSTQAAVFRPGTGQVIEEIAGNPTVIATFPVASGNVPLAAPLFYRMPADPPAVHTSPSGSRRGNLGDRYSRDQYRHDSHRNYGHGHYGHGGYNDGHRHLRRRWNRD